MYSRLLNFLFPERPGLYPQNIILLTLLGIPAIVIAVLMPLKAVIAICLAFVFLFIVYFYKIHVFQILMLIIMLGSIFVADQGMIFLLVYNSVFGLLMAYYFMNWCLSKSQSDNMMHQMMVYIFLAFAMIAFISMIINSRYSIEAFLEVARYFTLVGLFLISYKYISSEARIRRILLTIMFISIVGAAYSYWAVFTMGITGFILAGLTALRGFSELVINPNTIAMMIGNSLPLLLAYLMLGKNKKYNLIAILLFIFLAGIWLLWNSRSTYVFFFVAFLVLLAYHPKRLKYFSILITAMACIVLIVYISPALQGFLRLESGLSYRDQLWGAAIDIFKRNPAFGAGPTSYGEMKFGLMEPGMARSAMGTIVSGAAAHNLLVTKAAELGIGAVLIILTFWSLVIYYFFRNIKIMKGTKFYFLYIGCFASFMGLIVRSFFELGGFFGIGRLSDNLVPMLIVAIIIKLPVMQSKLQDYNYSHD